MLDRAPDVARFEVKNVAAVKAYVAAHGVPCEWRDVAGCRTLWQKDLVVWAERGIESLRSSAPDVWDKIAVVKDPEELRKNRVQHSCPGTTLTQVYAQCLQAWRRLAR